MEWNGECVRVDEGSQEGEEEQARQRSGQEAFPSKVETWCRHLGRQDLLRSLFFSPPRAAHFVFYIKEPKEVKSEYPFCIGSRLTDPDWGQ